MDCIKEARNPSVESGEKGLDLAGRDEVSERQKIEKILLELKQFKKQRISAK